MLSAFRIQDLAPPLLLQPVHQQTGHPFHTLPFPASPYSIMSNPLDTDAGSELFESYSAEFRLVQADLQQKLDQIPELSGEPRKAAISQAERALEEAEELVSGPSVESMPLPDRHDRQEEPKLTELPQNL